MAKPIYIPQEEVSRIVESVKAQLRGKCCGSVSASYTFKSDDRSALLYFTPTAWMKMTALVSEFTTEVQWHGLVKRISECEFEIYDVIVPPHTVTAATVTSDHEKYTNWINGLDDDTFNDLRFHGHSHVNMAVSPSVTDKDYRKDVITQLPHPDNDNDVFYIFLIINKSHSWSAEIYDLTYNALYSTTAKEIALMVMLEDGTSVDGFVAEAKKVAVQTTYPTTPVTSTNIYKGGAQHATQQVPASSGTGYVKKNDTSGTRARGADDYYGVDELPTDPFYSRDEWGWR